jgi:hypothetical protein
MSGSGQVGIREAARFIPLPLRLPCAGHQSRDGQGEEKEQNMKYGSARRPSRRMMKVGIAAAAAVAAGGAIFASQAGAATFRPHYDGLQSVNVMLKVPQGTTCAYVETFWHDGFHQPLRKVSTQTYDFRALHWNSSGWNSIGSRVAGFNVLRVNTIETSGPCPNFPSSPPNDGQNEFWVSHPGGHLHNDWIDASRILKILPPPQGFRL